jgi:hypothetical protein
MGTFLYFLPGLEAGIDDPDIGRLGLSHAFEAGVHQQHVSGRGPSGGAGLLVAAADRLDLARLKYVPAEQHWEQAHFPPSPSLRVSASPRENSIWIGHWVGELPRPADLARTKTVSGHWLDLGDGWAWLCPVARGMAVQEGELRYYHTLPRQERLAGPGKWAAGEVVPRYRRLWDLA